MTLPAHSEKEGRRLKLKGIKQPSSRGDPPSAKPRLLNRSGKTGEWSALILNRDVGEAKVSYSHSRSSVEFARVSPSLARFVPPHTRVRPRPRNSRASRMSSIHRALSPREGRCDGSLPPPKTRYSLAMEKWSRPWEISANFLVRKEGGARPRELFAAYPEKLFAAGAGEPFPKTKLPGSRGPEGERV